MKLVKNFWSSSFLKLSLTSRELYKIHNRATTNELQQTVDWGPVKPRPMEIELNKKPSASELLALFAQTSWANQRDHASVTKMLISDDLTVCLREANKLIGFGRIISDGCFRGILDDIIVDAAFRGKGYGSVIIRELLELGKDLEEIFLNANYNALDYYTKFGFVKFNGLTMIRKS